MNRHRSVPWLGIGVLLSLVLLSGCAAAAWLIQTPGLGSSEESTFGPLPAFGHVYLIVIENRPLNEIVGEHDAPYFNSLVARGALATNYHSVARPSQPNYVALISGSTQGITDDNVHDLAAPMLGDELDAGGRTWSVSAENLPSPCFTGATASGGRDGDCNYARKHEPFISFTSVSTDPARCGAHLHDLTAFDPAEASFQLIVPNLCHDGHDCPLSAMDQWLSGFVPRILDSAAFADHGVLFITADEGDRLSTTVPMLALGEGVQPGTRWNDERSHASWLRTIQDDWGLACLATSCDAQNLAGLFSAP